MIFVNEKAARRLSDFLDFIHKWGVTILAVIVTVLIMYWVF